MAVKGSIKTSSNGCTRRKEDTDPDKGVDCMVEQGEKA